MRHTILCSDDFVLSLSGVRKYHSGYIGVPLATGPYFPTPTYPICLPSYNGISHCSHSISRPAPTAMGYLLTSQRRLEWYVHLSRVCAATITHYTESLDEVKTFLRQQRQTEELLLRQEELARMVVFNRVMAETRQQCSL